MDAAKRIIVSGVDGSAAGQRALQWAIGEAVRGGGTVRAVTAWSWDTPAVAMVRSVSVEQLGAPTTPVEAMERAKQVLSQAVDRVLAGLEDPPVVDQFSQRGIPSEALCAAAADADLLVLGSHGHGQLHDRLVGSTSERAIHLAPCPVVVVPDPRHAETNRERARRASRQGGDSDAEPAALEAREGRPIRTPGATPSPAGTPERASSEDALPRDP